MPKYLFTLAIVVLCLLLIGAPETAVSQNGIFADSGQTFSNTFSTDVALGDVDNDGDLDAIVTNSANESNELWLNQGGAFTLSGQSLDNLTQRGLALADLDGDTDLDIFLVRGIAADSYQVWINQGGEQGGTAGQFQRNSFTVNDDLGTNVALGDLDGDNDVDAYIPRIFDADLVYLNNGGGGFTDSGQTLETADSQSAELADLDGDGDLDIFVVVNNGPNTIWINQGDIQGGTEGVFQDSGQALGNRTSMNAALGDVDNDGDTDAFVANATENIVWINQGGAQNGTPGVFQTNGQLLGFSSSLDVKLADLDGDGDLDAFVAEGAANTVWFNQGGDQGGTLGTFADSGQALGSEFSRGVALGDVDNDGDFDAFVANSGPAPNYLYLNGVGGETAVFDWQIQTIDVRGNVGQYADIAIDSYGHPHISYYEQTPLAGRLKYATWDGLSWHTEVIDAAADVGLYSAIVIDPQDEPHISYRDETNNDLKWARLTPSGWIVETVVGGQGDDGRYTDIAYSNGPQISYIDGSGKLIYMEWDFTTWIKHEVATTTSTARQSLAFDSSGNPHLSYYNGVLRYASWNGSQWSSVAVDNVPGSGVRSALAFDSSDVAHIAYSDAANGGLSHATFDGTSWSTGVVTTNPQTAAAFDLAIDSNDQPQITYFEGNELRIAHGTGPALWQFQTVDGPRVGQYVALAWDQQDRPHVAYFDRQYNDLKYAVDAEGWQIQQIQTNGVDGNAAQALLAGVPAFAVRSAVGSPPNLYLAEWQKPFWQLDPIAITLDIFDAMDFAYDEDGTPHLAYIETGAVYYATWNGGSQTSEVVSNLPANATLSTTMEMLSVGDQPILVYSYEQSSIGTIELAVPDSSGGWNRHALNVGSWSQPPTVFAAGTLSSGDVLISYFADTSTGSAFDTLFLMRWDGTQWSGTVVAQDITVTAVSLTVDQRYRMGMIPDVVAVTYHDTTNDQLRYATSTNEQFSLWDYQTLTTGLSQVGGLAVTLGEGLVTQPHVAYVDGSDNALVVLASETAVPSWTSTQIRPPGGSPRSRLTFAFGDRERLTYLEGTETYHAYRTANSLVAPANMEIGTVFTEPLIDGTYCAYFYSPVGFCTAYPDTSVCRTGLPGVSTRGEATAASLLPGDVGVLGALTDVFRETAAGTSYVDRYAQNDIEITTIMMSDPQLLWDSYRTLQDFMPGLAALTGGYGSQVVVTQEMADNALSIWTRIADDASPELATIIQAELAQTNDLQDFVGLTFNQWAESIGVKPPAGDLYLPIVFSN
jgi:hypothetical protein